MAKSARSSNTKRNNRNLRAKVFGPASDARTARLSAKLQELAARPRPSEEKAMDLDDSAEQGERDVTAQNDSNNTEEMEIDGQETKVVKSKTDHKQRRKEHRILKKKPKNQMVFASERARKAKMASKKSRR